MVTDSRSASPNHSSASPDSPPETMCGAASEEQAASNSPASNSPPCSTPHHLIPLADLEPDPRLGGRIEIDGDHVAQLAASIAAHGLYNPIKVRRAGDRFLIIAGNHRAAALLKAGYTHAPATILTDTEHDADRHALIDNLDRKNYTPAEEAVAIHATLPAFQHDVDAVAASLGKTPAWIRRRLQLAIVGPELLELVHTGQLTPTVALLLDEITDEKHRDYLTRQAVQHGATPSAVRVWAAQYHDFAQTADPSSTPPESIPNYGAPIIPRTTCLVCGELTPLRELTPCHAHPSCYARLADAHASIQADAERSGPPPV